MNLSTTFGKFDTKDAKVYAAAGKVTVEELENLEDKLKELLQWNLDVPGTLDHWETNKWDLEQIDIFFSLNFVGDT